MPRIEQRYRPGTLAHLNKTRGVWVVCQPGSPMFSTAMMLASIYLGADRKWKHVVPVAGHTDYVPDTENSPTFPGAVVEEL